MSDTLPIPKKKYKRLRIEDFSKGFNTSKDESVLPASLASLAVNFDFSSGALTDGYGLEDLNINPSQVAAVWQYKRFGQSAVTMFLQAGGDIFYLSDGAAHPLYVSVGGKVCAINYRLYGGDVIVIFSDEGGTVVWDGVNAAVTVSDSPKVKSIESFEGLVFIADADGETLRYTLDPDPTNWNGPVSEGGNIKLTDGRGSINKLLAFSNYLYVFRDYGITRISLRDGLPVASGVFTSADKINADTAVLCGDKVLFLLCGGIYEFDGINTKRVLENLSGFIAPTKNACAVYSGGKYFISVTARFKENQNGGGGSGGDKTETTENCLIVFDPVDKSYSVSRGLNITAMTADETGAFAVMNGKLTKIVKKAERFDIPLLKSWQSAFTDLGSERTKVLKEIHIETAGEIVLTVFTEKVSRTVALKGSSVPQRVRLNMRGKKLSLKIESDSVGAHITRPVLVYSEN